MLLRDRRDYRLLPADDLRDSHRYWQSLLGDWEDFANQYGVSRDVRRGRRRCHRRIRRIETAARKRGIRL